MAVALPPWLDIRPQQFTQAAIEGAQLGSRTASEAAQLAQRGIAQAQEIANRAEALQVQRENIAAGLREREMATAQRAAEAGAEQALKQQQFDLQRQAIGDATKRLADKDALWQDGLSRYQRAIALGQDAAAADMEILQPLRSIGVGEQETIGARGGSSFKFGPPRELKAPGSEWETRSLPNGGVIQVNKNDGSFREVREQDANGGSAKLDDLTKSKMRRAESELSALRRELRHADTTKARKAAIPAEMAIVEAALDDLLGGSPATAAAPAGPATPTPVGFIGTPGQGNQMEWPATPGTNSLRPPAEVAPGATPNYPTATNKKTGAKMIFKDGKWQTP